MAQFEKFRFKSPELLSLQPYTRIQPGSAELALVNHLSAKPAPGSL